MNKTVKGVEINKSRMTQLLMELLVEGLSGTIDRKDGEPIGFDEMASLIATSVTEEEMALIDMATASMIGVVGNALARTFGVIIEEGQDKKYC
ncbi:MAG: hypothetical protein ACRCX2_24015 [Paraclostridium sp.]